MKPSIALQWCSYWTCIILLLISCLPTTLSAPDTTSDSSRKLFSRLQEVKNAQLLQQMRELKIQQQDFTRSRDLLVQEGVPFDPNELLEPNWRERLASKFAEMSQMQVDRVVKSNLLKGSYIADTLYLPEKMKAQGDIMILARRLVYAGEDVEIIAPGHSVSIFIIESEEKTRRTRGPEAKNNRRSSPSVTIRTGALPPAVIRGAANQPMDTNPYTVWKDGKPNIINATWSRTTTASPVKVASVQQGQNRDGMRGPDGLAGVPGQPGEPGDNGANGANGTCPGSPNGENGTSGDFGGDGTFGGDGLPGERGDNAGPITASIPGSASGVYNYSARGGDGGRGGMAVMEEMVETAQT